MLMRSASTPILNSFTRHTAKDSSPEPEYIFQFGRIRSINLTASSPASLSPLDHGYSSGRMSRTLSESSLQDLAFPKKQQQPSTRVLDRTDVEEVEEETDLGGITLGEDGDLSIGSLNGIFLGLGLDSQYDVGCGCGGGGGSKDGDGGGDGWEDGRRKESLDSYYQRMIEADPGNPLLLSNYAKYLKELRGDLVKAEEYCGRAILMNPNDGDTLCMYGDLLWQQHKDAGRAKAYFDRAVKASPDDCYVTASYARFLWDVEEEPVRTSSPSMFHGTPPTSPSDNYFNISLTSTPLL